MSSPTEAAVIVHRNSPVSGQKGATDVTSTHHLTTENMRDHEDERAAVSANSFDNLFLPCRTRSGTDIALTEIGEHRLAKSTDRGVLPHHIIPHIPTPRVACESVNYSVFIVCSSDSGFFLL